VSEITPKTGKNPYAASLPEYERAKHRGGSETTRSARFGSIGPLSGGSFSATREASSSSRSRAMCLVSAVAQREGPHADLGSVLGVSAGICR